MAAADPSLIDLLLNLDDALRGIIREHGAFTHVILWLTIFCETGLVVMPFLPGDSLLFAAGLFARPGNGLNIGVIFIALPVASILGDFVNFHIGKFFGKKLFKSDEARIFKRSHLDKTRAFYQKYGAKTIIIGRFVPIVRTLAPFVAGMEAMTLKQFFPLSVLSSFIWVWICAGAGYLFGGIPWVKNNFEKVILLIVFLSVMMIVVEIFKTVQKEKREAAQAQPDTIAEADPS